MPGKTHLICQSGSRPVFTSSRRRQAYLDILDTCAAAYRVKVLAWSVLSKEAYLVVIPPSAEALGAFMRVVRTRYTRYLHAGGYRDEISPRRFASCPVDTAAAVDSIHYVESLPVAQRLADKAGKYLFSSASARLNGGCSLLSTDATLTSRMRDWTKRLARPLEEERVSYLLMRLRTGKPAGETPFVRSVERKVGMNLSRHRGRPRTKK